MCIEISTCGGVNDCCASLECDVNEPVARCVHAIELGNQNEEYEGSGRALIEETSQPANDTRSGIGKLARLKESIMNIFKHSEEATTTDRLVPKKILSLNGYIYNNQLKTTNKLSPLYNSLFFKNTIKSSSSSSSSSSTSSE